MTNELKSRRMDAALKSKGISSSSVYQLALKLLAECEGGGSLLEFGAGTGNLLKILHRSDNYVSLAGVDILARPSDLVEEIDWIATDLNLQVPLADASFDVIVSTEVIEHLENPRAVFREFNRLLKPKGWLVVTTPNQESVRSYFSLCFGGHFAAFRGDSYPAHITALLRKDLERICFETGFTPPRFRYTDSGGIPKIPSARWQQLSFGSLKGRLFSDNFGLITKKKCGTNILG